MHEVGISNGLNYYVDLRQTYLALKIKFVKGCGYETYKTEKLKKEHKEGLKADHGPAEEEQEAPVSLVTQAHNILHSMFSNVEVYINNQQIYNSNELYAHKSYISDIFRGPHLNTRVFCFAGGTTVKKFLMKLWKLFRLNFSPQGG